MKLTGHIVSHTHWDREWYLPFQEFRLRLVDLIDDLLDILADNPDYGYFTLDGQAVVLEDYLDVRPEREEELRRHVQAGRLLIGPWYILPDEFLVSGEATIRNLLLGRRICRQFGGAMNIGYVPDPFGHISQLPQILAGFGIESAVFRRGLSMEPTLLRWVAADGTQVFVVYLRDGYDNAAWLPTDSADFARAIDDRVQSLVPHTASRHILLMNGTDHMPPMQELPALMAQATELLDNITLTHSSLPQYLDAVRNSELGPLKLPGVRGELRSSERHHLLPGVLSTRMWIKQRNHALETLLERWAEPFSNWAWALGDRDRSAQVWRAWRYLLQNHPHDSICGCSIDQVHREMGTRFDWAEQIAETVAGESLATIAGQVDTADLDGIPIVVFNPSTGARTDVVTAEVLPPPGGPPWTIVDESDQPLATQIRDTSDKVIAELTLGRLRFRAILSLVQDGTLREWSFHNFSTEVVDDTAYVDVVVRKYGTPLAERLLKAQEAARNLLDQGISIFHLRIHTGTMIEAEFVATDIPGHGYRTFALRSSSNRTDPNPANLADTDDAPQAQVPTVENEFFEVEVAASDGTLSVRDKRTGIEFSGVNRFVDGGDRGDEYNYCPPANDLVIDRPAQPPTTTVSGGSARRSVRIAMTYRVPASLTDDRQARREEFLEIPVVTTVSLSPEVPRIDVRTTVDNGADDHRLRVHFPTPIRTDCSIAEGQFDVVERPVSVPHNTDDWAEQPVSTHPQRRFVNVRNDEAGLMIANRGLPEYEVIPDAAGSTIALTLLRCVGWLSRDDFPCRDGHAGPFLATPEAQCHGEYTFEYSMIPHAGDWQAVYPHAYAFCAPLRAMSTGRHSGSLSTADCLIKVEPASFVITAIKASEAGDGVIVRGFNIDTQSIEARVRPSDWARSMRRVNLAEETLETLEPDADGWVSVPASPRQIVTLKLVM